MTRRHRGTVIIEVEKPTRCELCGKVAETRPYGPNGARVCFECGMKNKKETERRFRALLEGTN